jgi:predicted DNA binding CopG/RHH family protein
MNVTHKKHQEEAWENRELGATESFVRKVSPDREKALDEKLELQIISIRLQKNLIDVLKELAGEDGLGYQPYIRQVLTQHVRNAKRKREKHLRVIDR